MATYSEIMAKANKEEEKRQEKIRPRVLPRKKAIEYIGGPVVLQTLEKLGYIAPLPNIGLKQDYFDVKALDKAVARWESGM